MSSLTEQPPTKSELSSEPRAFAIDWRSALIWYGVPSLYAGMALTRLHGRPEFDQVAAFAVPQERIVGVLRDSRWQPDLVILYGENGNGKSHMGTWLFSQRIAAALASFNTRMKAGTLDVGEFPPSGLWVQANRITAALKAFSRGGFDYERELAEYTRPAVLMVDDLFADGASDYDAANLTELIDRRLSAGKATIITSNKGPIDIGEAYSRRLADRLAGGEVVRFTGKSHRGVK